ncbi:MAG: LamG-like jellyroll fold domain-containing protein [Candidatus Woesearchaeota archaeon]
MYKGESVNYVFFVIIVFVLMSGLSYLFYFSEQNMIDQVNLVGQATQTSSELFFRHDNLILFDGNKDPIDYTNNYTGAKFSISVWIKIVDALDNAGGIVEFSNPTGKRRGVFIIKDGRLGVLYGSEFMMTKSPVPDISDGDWHHIVVMHSGSRRSDPKLYVDGSVINDWSEGISANDGLTNLVRIGDTLGPNELKFKGKIDDIFIYNRMLTANEIRFLFLIRKPDFAEFPAKTLTDTEGGTSGTFETGNKEYEYKTTRDSVFIQDIADGCNQNYPNDINGDNILNAIDAQLVINGALGFEEYKDNMCLDVNSDGSVDSMDIQKVVNDILGVGPRVVPLGIPIVYNQDQGIFCDILPDYEGDELVIVKKSSETRDNYIEIGHINSYSGVYEHVTDIELPVDNQGVGSISYARVDCTRIDDGLDIIHVGNYWSSIDRISYSDSALTQTRLAKNDARGAFFGDAIPIAPQYELVDHTKYRIQWQTTRFSLYKQEGSGDFVEVEPETGYFPEIGTRRVRAISFSPMLNDNQQFMFLSVYGINTYDKRSKLYLITSYSDGNIEMEDITERAGLDLPQYGIGSDWFDQNSIVMVGQHYPPKVYDLDVSCLLNTDENCISQEMSDEMELTYDYGTYSYEFYDVAVGDLDGDEFEDIVFGIEDDCFSTYNPNHVSYYFLNNGDGTFDGPYSLPVPGRISISQPVLDKSFYNSFIIVNHNDCENDENRILSDRVFGIR